MKFRLSYTSYGPFIDFEVKGQLGKLFKKMCNDDRKRYIDILKTDLFGGSDEP